MRILILALLTLLPVLAQKERPLERLQKMSPEERAKVLEKLPPQRRANIEQRLAEYDKLPQEDKARFNRFRELPPERQQAVRRAFFALNNMPEKRRHAVRAELRHLRSITPQERANRILSPAFRDLYNPREQRILEELSEP